MLRRTKTERTCCNRRVARFHEEDHKDGFQNFRGGEVEDFEEGCSARPPVRRRGRKSAGPGRPSAHHNDVVHGRDQSKGLTKALQRQSLGQYVRLRYKCPEMTH